MFACCSPSTFPSPMCSQVVSDCRELSIPEIYYMWTVPQNWNYRLTKQIFILHNQNITDRRQYIFQNVRMIVDCKYVVCTVVPQSCLLVVCVVFFGGGKYKNTNIKCSNINKIVLSVIFLKQWLVTGSTYNFTLKHLHWMK